MIPRLEYIKKRIKLFKKWTPKLFHREITRQMYELYAPLINFIDDEDINKSIQTGAGIEKTHILEFDGYEFKVNVEKEDNEILINILTYKESNPLSCGNIIVDRKSRIAVINNISYHKDCAKLIQSGLPENVTGSMILKFILKFLKKNKEALNINRIVLKDNSFKVCLNCPPHTKYARLLPRSKNIKLSNLNLLLYGDTWYGKYGFRPYDKMNEIPDKAGIKAYNKNTKIITDALVKDVNLIDHVRKGVYKYKLYDINVNAVIKKIKEWDNRKLSEVLMIMMKDYDRFCCLFEYIENKLIDELGLRSFHNDPFYLDI